MIISRALRLTAFIAAALLVAPALRAAGPNEAQRLPTIETFSPGGVEVSSATGRWIKGRLLVSGSVHRKFGYSYPGPSQSHLDFIVLDATRHTLSLSQGNYLPRPIPIVYRGIPSRSTYAEYLPIVPPNGATVRVAHHETSIKECRRSHPAADTEAGTAPCGDRSK